MPDHAVRLGPDFFAQPTAVVAAELLGKALVSVLPDGQRVSGLIVEVEAYLNEHDEASHSAPGPNKKNASMFGPPGTLYVYAIHAKHCLNVVTEQEGCGAAVLIRALEPWEGQTRMAEHRRLTTYRPADLTTGPGRLCQALGIDRRHDGLDLVTSPRMFLEHVSAVPQQWSVCRGPRIGISRSQELPLRWFIDGQRFVSGLARDHSRGRYWHFNAVPANA